MLRNFRPFKFYLYGSNFYCGPKHHVGFSVGRDCCRMVSCTSVLHGRRRDTKNESFTDKLDRVTLSMLKRWPFLHDYYLQMARGFRRHGTDIKTWWRVRSKLSANPNYQTTYQEHKAVFDTKSNLTKTTVLLPLFLLPMGMVIIIIPVMVFPQYLLPRYYWNDSQRQKYFTVMHQRRTFQHAMVLHHLTYLKNKHESSTFREILKPLLQTMNNSDMPSNKDLLRLRDYCRGIGNPLDIPLLPPLLLSSLCQINFLWNYFPPSWLAYLLNQRAILIMQFDEKLRRESFVYDLTEHELHDATFMRGLDCTALSKEANQYWLKNWITLTKNCTAADTAFVIHAAILLSRNYNETKFRRRIFDGQST